jgi:alpha-tubulin suppressor-like RCC1 family protein
MSTKIIIPRATSEDSSIGTPEKNWGDGYFDDLHCLSNFYCPLVTSDARGIGEIGESKFDTTINALIIWNGEEWLELGATTQVELVLIAGEGGTVEGAGQYSKGAPVIISAVPENSNYVFSYWNGDVSYLQDDKSAQTFVTLSKATTQLTAVFSAQTYNIFTSVEGGENDEIPGLVTTDPVGAAFPAETTITFTASTYSAFSGKYAFGFWAGEYIENNPEQRNNNPLTINSLSSHINLQAVFELQSKTITMQKYVDDDNSELLSHFENNVELLLNGLPLPLGEGNVHEYGFGNSFTFSFSIDADSSYYAFDKWEIINNEGTSSQFISSTISDHTLDENIVVRAYFKAVDSNNNQIPDLYDAVIQVGEIDSDKDGIIDSYDDNILTAATSNLTVTDQDITNGLNTAYYDLENHNTKYNISAQLTHQIIFTTNSDGVGDITYTSGDENIVTVSDTGLITVVGAGSTTITIFVPETDTYTDVIRTLRVLVTDQTDTDGDGIPDNDDTAPNQIEQTITWGQNLTGLTGVTIFDATTSDEDSVITYTLSATTLGTLDGNTFTPSNSTDLNPITVTATASATLTSFETSVTKDLTLDQTDSDGDGIPDRIDNFPNQTEQTITWGQDLNNLTDTITFNATTDDNSSVITYTLSETTLGTLEGNTFTPSNSTSTGSITVTATASATEASFEKTLEKTLTLDQTDSDGDGIPDRLQGLDFVSSTTLIAAGADHSVYIQNDTTVLAAGANTDGQLGDGTITQQNNPVQVKLEDASSTFNDVVSVSGGLAHTLYLKSNRTVWAAGSNTSGQLGDGTQTNSSNPVQVKNADDTALSEAVAISAGWVHSAYLKSDGTVWASGQNSYGQLGDGTQTNSSNPVQVKNANGSVFDEVVGISTSFYHTVYLKSDGTVWASGWNVYGQLGDGTQTNSSNPVQVIDSGGDPLTNVVAIAAGWAHTVYLKKDGTVWAVGYNVYGELADGTSTLRSNPVQAKDADDTYLTDVVNIFAGIGSHTAFLKSDNTVWAAGLNDHGQLGNGTKSGGGTLRQAMNADDTPFSGVVDISLGRSHTVYLKNDGTVWTTGRNIEGQLANGELQADESLYPIKSSFYTEN